MYSFTTRVRYSETDEYGKLSLTGIMNYFQDCSTFQSEDLGMGISYLAEHKRAWWLSSWQIGIERYPRLGEEIVIGTWPYDFKGFYGYRNFVIRDREGNDLVKANSVWFFFDTEKGRPVKIGESDIRGYGSGRKPRLDMEYADRKISLPDTYETAEPVTVVKHHIDTNHHVNNAQYVEIVREVLPADLWVKELRVEYKQAAVCGSVMIPRISGIEDGYVTALCNEQGGLYAVVELRGVREEHND